ncbi:hypothetical protein COCOBI_01-2780 [Coccomyxa sp. Obi]|nr:hypothetical protein COCOBI_01-2780 [Coccomyxa sp. Obi]
MNQQQPSSLPFHVNCPFTGQATCRCSLGTPSSVAEQSAEYQRQAAMMNQMWQQQNQLFPPQQLPPVDIVLPRLMRQTLPELEPLPPQGPMDRKTAENAVRQARSHAEAALIRAARMAAAAGIDFNVPPGFQVDLSGIVKSDTRELEMRARALERTLAERRARSQQASASQSFPALDDGRQSPYGREADRGARAFQQQRSQQQQQQQQQQQFAGGWAVNSAPKQKQKADSRSQYEESPRASGQNNKSKSKASKAQGESSDAWDTTPDKALRLKMKDIKQSLKDRWLQLFWPEDGRWWPGQVTEVHAKERKISLLYKTGEEETDLDVGEMVRKGEVAWLNAEEMKAAGDPPPGAYSAPENGGFERHEQRSNHMGGPKAWPMQSEPLDFLPLQMGSMAGMPRQRGGPSNSQSGAFMSGPRMSLGGGFQMMGQTEDDPFEQYERQLQERQRLQGTLSNPSRYP